MIDGVTLKSLKTHADERGVFREIVRVSDDFFTEGFGQWSHSVMYQNVIKAWHLHRVQVDWWYVSGGCLRVGLCDLREESRTFKETMDFMMGDHQPVAVVRIPPGVAHGCKVVQGPASLFYITSHVYNPNDELRIPHDDPDIGFDWLKGPVIK